MDFGSITPCGESCGSCQKKADGFCQGCLASDGHCKEWEQSRGCPIYRCAKKHDVKFCGLCPEFPCERMLRTITWRENIVAEMRELASAYAKASNVHSATEKQTGVGT